jgi:hypothetical protein
MRALLIGTFWVLALLSPTSAIVAQDMDVPMAVQIPVMLKVLSFDRQLRARAGNEMVIGVVYQSGNRASTLAREDAVRLLSAARDETIGLPIRVIVIDLDRDDLAEILKQRSFTALYIAPLRATNIGALAAVFQQAGARTMTGVVRYVDLGLAIGVGQQGGRPKIFMNLQSSRLEGADFPAELLKLAQIVRP